VEELTLLSVTIRVVLAIVLSGIIGLERGMKNRPAGLRTYMLVSLGACLVMMTNQYVYQAFNIGDPTRMGAQVISGIGFLGAGTIIVTARNQIKGLTTAAGLWASAGLGVAVGIGFYAGAVICAVLMFIILSFLHDWDNRMRKRTRQAEVYVELRPNVTLATFIRFAREHSIDTNNLQLENEMHVANEAISFVVTIKSACKQNHDEMIRTLRSLQDIAYIEEL